MDGITNSNGHEFEQALGVGDGQGSLVCCSPWGRKELDTIEQLNRTEPYTWIKSCYFRTSLAGQWLGLCESIAGGAGSTTAWGTKILSVAWPKQQEEILLYYKLVSELTS